MHFLATLLLFFLALFLLGGITVGYHLWKGWRLLKKMTGGQMRPEDLQRMWGQPQQPRRTTTTADGVTVEDRRDGQGQQKIFAPDEGEYVDFTETT